MSFLDLFLPSEKTAGKAQMAFDHPTVYNQLTSGQGPEGLSRAADGLAKGIVSRLEAMNSNLQRALKTSQGAWAGHAADSASSSTTPLSDAVQSSREISGEIGKQVNIQADHFGKVKTMPPPKKVDPIDLGIGGYTPAGFLVEQADKEIQERQANAAEESARQQYTTYQESTTSTTGSMTRYSPVPNPLTSVGTADTRPPGTVDPNSNYTGGDTGNTATTSTTSTDSGSTGNSGRTDSGGPVLQPDIQPENPAKRGINWPPPDETHSEWNTPAPTPPPGPGQPSPTPPPPGTGGGAGAGAIGMMPGAGAAGGGAGGAGGATGRGGSMGGRIGPGGTSGIGSASPSASGSTAGGTSGARGGAGAGAMGGGAGRGRGGEEDEEHQRKYVEDSDEPFEFDAEVDEDGNVVAPPVIGQYRLPSQNQ